MPVTQPEPHHGKKKKKKIIEKINKRWNGAGINFTQTGSLAKREPEGKDAVEQMLKECGR